MVDKKLLAEKIDSEEKYVAAVGKSVSELPSAFYSAFHVNGDLHRAIKVPWWHEREMMRIKHGIYKATVLTDGLNAAWPGQHAVHVSREDPAQLAYTASVEDGERDKQLRVSPGRFIRKYFPLFTDKQIQALEETHKADLDSTYLVARTEADIRMVYTTMQGDSGCMRRGGEWFGGTNTHPSVAYTGPGFGVAYLRSPSNHIIARCVIWVNPEKPDDKRAVRIYGHPTLKRKLLADGFTFKALTGAKLAKVPLPKAANHDNHYYLPYLDGPEGYQSDQAGSHVRISVDGNHLEIISASTATKVAQQGFSVAQARTTAGAVRLNPPPAEEVLTSLITGARIRKFADQCIKCVKLVEGVFVDGWATPAELVTAGYVTGRYELPGVRAEQRMAPRDQVVDGYILTPRGREILGMHSLSSAYYPAGSTHVRVVTETDTGHVIRAEDAIGYLDQAGNLRVVHMSRTRADRMYVKATPMKSVHYPVYIHKNRPTLRIFGTRTYFDLEFHKSKFVVLDNDGSVVKATTVRYYALFNMRFAVPRTWSRWQAARLITQEHVQSYIRQVCQTWPRPDERKVQLTNAFVGVWGDVRCMHGGAVRDYWRPSYEDIKAYHTQHAVVAERDVPEQHRIFNLIDRELNNVREV